MYLSTYVQIIIVKVEYFHGFVWIGEEWAVESVKGQKNIWVPYGKNASVQCILR